MTKTKKKVKTIPKLKKDLWTIFSRYIRLRDAIRTTGRTDFAKCITCKEIKETKKGDAGHFVSRTKSCLYFDEKNCHFQCKQCNMPPDPGEQAIYMVEIEKLYGKEELERLMHLKKTNPLVKWNRKELEEKIAYYKKEVKKLIEKHGSPWL